MTTKTVVQVSNPWLKLRGKTATAKMAWGVVRWVCRGGLGFPRQKEKRADVFWVVRGANDRVFVYYGGDGDLVWW